MRRYDEGYRDGHAAGHAAGHALAAALRTPAHDHMLDRIELGRVREELGDAQQTIEAQAKEITRLQAAVASAYRRIDAYRDALNTVLPANAARSAARREGWGAWGPPPTDPAGT